MGVKILRLAYLSLTLVGFACCFQLEPVTSSTSRRRYRPNPIRLQLTNDESSYRTFLGISSSSRQQQVLMMTSNNRGDDTPTDPQGKGGAAVTEKNDDESSTDGMMPIEEATDLLTEWDKLFNRDQSLLAIEETFEMEEMRDQLPQAILSLNTVAARQRNDDPTTGRCMLGICASSASEGVAALKSYVTNLQLPRGLLHGMDKDGVPIDLDGGVYIKYNTGGVMTFADIRKSGLGFDALWKPGDALLEPYDGTYRGVYFQVELSDEIFRQYLVPLDIFESGDTQQQ